MFESGLNLARKSKTILPPAKRQTRAFEHTRNARRSAVGEDYLELIADLIDSSEGRPVRAVDLVRRLGVAQPTVAKMVSRLRREGWVARGRGTHLELTRDGRAIAINPRSGTRSYSNFCQPRASANHCGTRCRRSQAPPQRCDSECARGIQKAPIRPRRRK